MRCKSSAILTTDHRAGSKRLTTFAIEEEHFAATAVSGAFLLTATEPNLTTPPAAGAGRYGFDPDHALGVTSTFSSFASFEASA